VDLLGVEYGLAIWIGAPALVALIGVIGIWVRGRRGPNDDTGPPP
jgi:xanthosine utilization system XapX-like protein